MKHIFVLLAALFAAVLLSGCIGRDDPVPPPDSHIPVRVSSRVQSILDQMTPEEKVGQLFFVRVPEENAASDVAEYHLGGYIFFGRDVMDRTPEQVRETVVAYQSQAELPLLIGVDEEGGTVARLSRNPAIRPEPFLSPQELIALGGMDAVLSETEEKDALLHALGFNVNLAPVADVSTDPEDFIYARTFGQNAEKTADYIAEVIGQMNHDRMGSVLKHFPGYGNNVDTHTGIAVDRRPLSRFEEADFLPFLAGFEVGAPAVMVSHNIMTAVDNKLPASLSPAVHQLLRKELDFRGVVMTDDLAMDAVAEYAGDSTAAVLAIQAGNDLLISDNYQEDIPGVLRALKDGVLSEGQINNACSRVLNWKEALGLLDD